MLLQVLQASNRSFGGVFGSTKSRDCWLGMSFEVLFLLSEESELSAKPHRQWLGGLPSLNYYRRVQPRKKRRS
jgi:hypothetical protein